jgi:hypothetical protein
MLKAEGKITDSVIENMLSWHHSGFNVYCGNAVWPHNEEALRIWRAISSGRPFLKSG